MHPNLRIRQIALVNIIVLLFFCLDRIFKYYFIKNPAVKIGGDFFSFHLEKNSGIAFGLLFNQIIIVASVIIILLLLMSLLIKSYKEDDWRQIFSLSIICAGAISNLIDRFNFGYVIDYIDVPWFTVFNLADCLITLGVIILIFLMWLRPVDKTKNLR